MKLLLASASPRRKELLELAGFNFDIKVPDVDESVSHEWNITDAPEFLAKKKALAVFEQFQLDDDTVVIAADTMVFLDNIAFGKPKNEDEALFMLKKLSNKMHEVVTGVCIRSAKNEISFIDLSKVFFRSLQYDELDYYIKNHNPFDKAGGYGIQDWIGVRIVERIEGCYFNVMGMPMRKVAESLKQFGIIGIKNK